MVSSREQDWTEQEVAVESTPTIIYQEVSGGDSQSAASTIKALLELQQTAGESRRLCRPGVEHQTSQQQQQRLYEQIRRERKCEEN